ncbi:hypothetical protein SAMN04488066_101145 [Halorubrum aquaticum]|uniref:SipW-cognate class signal peptide n=1 Tax=Halorubrum aquaticum TaxID=387340 RepID=A0A1I2Z1S9_9EURY|nr:hypothetical protein [Halorubrum aquaticum]SFH31852.1 hypothetical protein SAMN04488066_101145 [Halorubrum aquaticum]
MTNAPISRRRLLAGLTGGSAAALAGVALSTGRSRAYTDTMPLRTEAIEGLVLDWRETYNGTVLEDSTAGTATPTPSGSAIALGNVLPGDAGSLSVRLRIETDGSGGSDAPAVEPELTFSLTDGAESTAIREFLDVAVWYDTGLLDVDALGSDNADRDPGERLVHPDASGTFGEVAEALGDGVVLDASPNTPGASCLGADGAVTVTFGWAFPPNREGINAAQGETIEFDLEFDVTEC